MFDALQAAINEYKPHEAQVDAARYAARLEACDGCDARDGTTCTALQCQLPVVAKSPSTSCAFSLWLTEDTTNVIVVAKTPKAKSASPDIPVLGRHKKKKG